MVAAEAWRALIDRGDHNLMKPCGPQTARRRRVTPEAVVVGGFYSAGQRPWHGCAAANERTDALCNKSPTEALWPRQEP